MRTLSRPMFNMGGPIKQGVMNGIREPKKDGGLSQQFNTGLVGDERYPKTSGREHHVGFLAPILWGAGRALARPFARQVIKQLPKFTKIKWKPGGSVPSKLHKGYPGGAGKGTWERGATISGPQKVWEPTKLGSWFAKDPLAKTAMTGAGWTGKGLQFAGRGIKRGLTTPSGLAMTGGTAAWMFWPDGTKKTDAELAQTGGVPGGGDPGMTYTKEKTKMSQAQRDAFAMAQRTKRVQKYLDMMGYDASKKTAIADALIDASKIVSDRGTLDLKNINRDLINPIIQATSKRLDKPGQIREAVGLMSTKAEIEKDLSAETDALAKTLTMKKIEQADRSLEQGFETDIRNLLLSARTPPGKKQLEQYARLTADKYGESFTMISDEKKKTATGETEDEKLQSLVTGDGIYMIGENLIRVIGGVPKHIV